MQERKICERLSRQIFAMRKKRLVALRLKEIKEKGIEKKTNPAVLRNFSYKQ